VNWVIFGRLVVVTSFFSCLPYTAIQFILYPTMLHSNIMKVQSRSLHLQSPSRQTPRFLRQLLLLFERSYYNRTQMQLKTIGCNITVSFYLVIHINICVPCLMHVPTKLIVTDGRDTITNCTIF